MNNMPPKLRKQLAADPEYKICLRADMLRDHMCEPDPLSGKLIEWEHAIYFKGRQLQEAWAIVPLCWWAHRGPGFDKEINVFLALNRASNEELQAISKATDYIRERRRLTDKYL